MFTTMSDDESDSAVTMGCCCKVRRERPQASLSGGSWIKSPTLQLLSTPWEYLVTIDQSALWQKHIAWAKPKGSDLKAYISSQYSSRMVLLSLLLATEMSVFFNSSPELVNLRKCLSLTDEHHNNNNWRPFCIGFVLLLNICVTISGILATFTTWNVVSAVSDSNAHCMLRSSLGQYVTTLSPRLVVASLYLFFLWFLLFVTELIVSSQSTRVAGYWHLIVLWVCFLVGVVALFFSIVVPLSAFGRLVLHTGAMSEHPVLSESLEHDLLPRGLHAGLVLRAHHSQRRKKTVTRQYRQRQDALGGDPQRPLSYTENDETDRSYDPLCVSSGRFQSVPEASRNSPSIFGTKKNDSMLDPQNSCQTSHDSGYKLSRRSLEDDRGHRNSDRHRTGRCSSQHRRVPTNDTAMSLSFPPATILNLSMTAKEFHELINNAIDTSSVELNSDANLIRNTDTIRATASIQDLHEGSEGREKNGTNEMKNDAAIPIKTQTINGVEEASLHESGTMVHPTTTVRNASNRIYQSNQSYQHLVTKHHRRVSSSRFLLEEWAQENQVRDLYGAGPPADLPREVECAKSPELLEAMQPTTRSPEMAVCSRGRSIGNWMSSPFYSPTWSRSADTITKLVGGKTESWKRTASRSELRRPLLPDLTSSREDCIDEELGG